MRIGQRLLMAIAPGIVGVLAVAALAYWGERERQIPSILLAIVAVVIVFSLWFAWVTTRELAHRIERLGQLVDAHAGKGSGDEHSLLVGLAREALSRISGSGKAGADELDPVERLVAKYDGELTRLAEQRRQADDRIAEARAEASRLLYDASDRVSRRLDDVRLPLHVLLDTPFGELNENQEELIGAARAAADQASAEARSVRELASLELSAGGRRDRIAAGDLLRSLIPGLEAEARRARVRLSVNVAPALPAVMGDRARLQEAIREILARIIRSAEAESDVTVSSFGDTDGVKVNVTPLGNLALADLSIEKRVIEALGGRLEFSGGTCTIVLSGWR